MKVTLRVMSALSVGGMLEFEFPDDDPPTVAAVLDASVAERPAWVRSSETHTLAAAIRQRVLVATT